MRTGKRLTRICLYGVVGLLTTPWLLSAQTAVDVLSAELSVPLDVSKGHVVLVGDDLVFVSTEDPSASFAVARSSAGSAADGDRADAIASYQAQHNHRLRGNCLAQVIITRERIAFESVSDLDHSRQWAYSDIRELKQDGIYKLEVTPLIGNKYDRQLVGRGMDSAQYRDLVDRIGDARSR